MRGETSSDQVGGAPEAVTEAIASLIDAALVKKEEEEKALGSARGFLPVLY